MILPKQTFQQAKTQVRQSFDEYMLSMAELVGSRSTCRHRKQGAILVVDNRVISTGYNGSPPGIVHCTDLGYCMKADHGWCRADGLHGESNAILTAARLGIPVKGGTLYSTYSPCRVCCNMLKVAGVVRVVYSEVYENFKEGPSYLKELGIIIAQPTRGKQNG
jgi:dCMP deaminase